MKCSDFHEKIDLYLEGEMNASNQSLFESHLNECERCRKDFEKAKKILADLKTLQSAKASPQFADAVMKKLRQEKKVKDFFLSRRLIIPLELAAVLAIAFFVFHEMLPRHPISKNRVILQEIPQAQVPLPSPQTSGKMDVKNDLLKSKDLELSNTQNQAYQEDTSPVANEVGSLPAFVQEARDEGKEERQNIYGTLAREPLAEKSPVQVENSKPMEYIAVSQSPLQKAPSSRPLLQQEESSGFSEGQGARSLKSSAQSLLKKSAALQKWQWFVLDPNQSSKDLEAFLKEKKIQFQPGDEWRLILPKEALIQVLEWLRSRGTLEEENQGKTQPLSSQPACLRLSIEVENEGTPSQE